MNTEHALYDTLKEMYGTVGAAMALREIDYWHEYGVMPVDAQFIEDIRYAHDGSLIYVHKDWSD